MIKLALLKSLKDSLRFNSSYSVFILNHLRRRISRQFYVELEREIKLKNLSNSVYLIDSYLFKNYESLIKNIEDENNYYDVNNWLKDASGTNDPETMNDVEWNID